MTLTLRPAEARNLAGLDTGRDHLSASGLSSLLNCQRRYQLHYVERLRLLAKPKPLSLGAAYALAIETQNPHAGEAQLREQRPIWTQEDQDELEMDCAIVHAAAALYLERWPQAPAQQREFEFKVRLRNPWTGYQSRTFDLLGYADAIYPIVDQHGEQVSWCLVENKFVSQITAVSIKRLPLDRQIALMCYGIWRATGLPVTTVDYRFVRKPTIRQRQGETVEEYNARLGADYVDRPEFYAVNEVWERSDDDLLRTEAELWVWADQLRQARATGFWPRNTSHCADFGGCAYIPVCTGDPDAHHLYERKPRDADHRSPEPAAHREGQDGLGPVNGEDSAVRRPEGGEVHAGSDLRS